MAVQQHGDPLSDGGPLDRSVLKHQEVHRSQAIWNAEIPGSTEEFDKDASLKVYRRTWKQKPVENAAFIEYMKALGFWDVWCTGHVPIEAAVVTALVERWRPETHTFHMPVGEMTITLQDVAVLYGLPINGLPLTGDQTPTDWPEMCLTCFGRNPKSIPGGAIGNTIQLKWLEETYDPAELADDADDETVRHYVRASILRLIGCILFPETTESRVNSCWVPMLLDFDSIASYSWGSACLAHLFHQLCRATNRDASVISGDLGLLTMWAAERIVPLRFVLKNPVGQEYHQALGRRWSGQINRRISKKCILVEVYRSKLDRLKDEDVVWVPYTEGIIANLPGICHRDQRLWLARVPLISFYAVEWHYPDRVFRQFGYVQELGIKKILIVDWDVHHGNGTQKMFWEDSRVLFFSVHRHEFGCFYPANDDGFYTMIGEGQGTGYNINVPWENGRCGDADYIAVWDHILIPVAKEFDPDMIIVSAGFDAAIGDPLGGCCVTPHGYSVMLKKLMDFAQGRIVLALEGGYNLNSIAKSSLACMEVLLDGKLTSGSSEVYPFESTWRVIQAVRKILSTHWSALADELPLKLPSQKTPSSHLLVSSSDSEDEDGTSSNVISVDPTTADDIVGPLSKLKVDDSNDVMPSISWRSELSKIDIWYATYGSNMWKPRFFCYIEGGQVEGMKRPCSGSMDKNPPKEVLWKTFPHRLFFGRESTLTWGPGGVAFLHPESSDHEKAYLCLYRITLEQFNDVLHQENVPSSPMASPAVDSALLDSIEKQGAASLEVFKNGWYNNVVYLGKEQGIPILTMTCPQSAIGGFKSGKVPLRAPGKGYADTLVRGLVEGGQLSEEEATAYIAQASARPL